MIYTIRISLLVEKPFYLLRTQSFSFQIVSEFIDTFVKFSNFMSQGWGFWLPVLSRGEGFCTQWLSRREGFCSLQVVSRGGRDGFGWNLHLYKWSEHNLESNQRRFSHYSLLYWRQYPTPWLNSRLIDGLKGICFDFYNACCCKNN